ncbi:DUF4292 domain-containing protein [Pontibacter arcticus]|uniref:DUF4292 domain-containing protein n=1 Tax=Pontibacter arcticus TaxID=2080288 RepID=A0A364RCS7_9BACT|nr:DUF4292 domain-containing protein [Pontibacter arcticus]RAU82083.1 DUF4292 domain-containing protein [Pontibacter arcticus]
MSKYILGAILGLFLLTGCKKEIIPTTGAATTETIGSVTVKNLDFNYLSAKSQLKFSDRGDNLSSGASIRIKKDSVIWVSVQPGLGIEAARLKMTQDSVFVMNRLQREYTATGYTYLSNKFNVAVDFNVLQAILLGNFQALGSEKVITEGDLQHVQQIRENLLLDYFIGNQNAKLQSLKVQDQSNANTITVKYENFQDVGATPFAYSLNAQVAQKGQLSDLEITHSRVTISDDVLDFPFSVPSDYKRVPAN